MALGTFIAGRYSATKNSVDQGISRNGYTVSWNAGPELVDESDAYGMSVIDMVYRGGNMFVDYMAKEYKAGPIAACWPWAARGVLSDTATPVGRLASALADAFVLTAVANTPAAATPATHTATLSILAPNFDVKTLFDSKLRELPLRLQYLPVVIGGAKVGWFVET